MPQTGVPRRASKPKSAEGTDIYIADGDVNADELILSVSARNGTIFAHIIAHISHEQMIDLVLDWLHRLPKERRAQITQLLTGKGKSDA